MKDLFRILKWAMGLRSPYQNFQKSEIDPAVLLEIRYKTMAEKNKIALKVPLMEARFIVFDLETTGLYPFGGDEITSIGAVIVENGQLKKEPVFNELVNPKRPIPSLTTEITGITDDMVKDAPSVLWAINEFLDFCRGSILVAHNAQFDLSFLNLKLKQYCHTSITHPIVDTYLLAGAFLTDKQTTNLDYLIEYFNLNVHGRHTSVGDSIVTAEILIKFLHLLAKKGIYTLEDLFKSLNFRPFH